MKKLFLLVCIGFILNSNAQNNAFTFNGVDQWVQTYTQQANIDFTTQNFTIEAWVKPAAFVSGTGTFDHTILGNDYWDAATNSGYVLRTGGSRKLDFTFGEGTNWHSIVSTNAVFTVDQWTHVAVVRDGTSFTLYANGVQVAQQTFTQNMAGSKANLRIAENGKGSERKWNGAIDEVKFWNTARTLSEVREDLAATATPLPTELVVYYKMNQTTGQAVISETAVNLFAQYFGTPQVNTAVGFFRTYTFVGGFNANNFWDDAPNWVNGFVPSNLKQEVGDIINLNVSCQFKLTSGLTISAGVTLNNSVNKTLAFYEKCPFVINGVVNNFGSIYNNIDNFDLSFVHFQVNGLLNNLGTESNIYYRKMKINQDAIVNNQGEIKFSLDYKFYNSNGTGSLNLNNNAVLNNDTTGFIYVSDSEIQDSNSIINNKNYIEFDGSLINYGTINNVVTGVNSPILQSNRSITNKNIINNFGNGLLDFKKSVSNTGTINNFNKIVFEHNSTNFPFKNSGTINNQNQVSELLINTDKSKFVNTGVLNYEGTIINNGVFQNEGSGVITSKGLYSQFENNAGGTYSNSGNYISRNGFTNLGSHSNTGTHSGGGIFSGSLFTNPTNGTIAPTDNSGQGIATLNFINGLTNNGNINIEIGGLIAGSGHDSINVTGTATIAGTLNASIINGYIPPVGTTDFTIISATSISGTFATVNLPVATQGVAWSIIYTTTAVKLRAVVRAITNTFLITRCDTYTWPTNNQTYTSSGDYFYPVPNSNITLKLALTILPASEVVTTQTACGSFYWAHNFTIYNQSGTYIGNTFNCVTQKLILTIIPETDNITTISACDSYTWNGQTYTTSGIKTGTTTNCVIEKLNLTITPSSENNVFETACGSYTWAANGQSYNSSGIYTETNNCVTQKLNLTIFPITTSSLTVTACNGYSWPEDEDFIDKSGIYTYTDNCETQTLNLTINQGPTITGSSDQNLSSDATLASIVTTPSDVVWYDNFEDALDGTAALSNNQVVQDGTTYYAVANDGTCPSKPFPVFVTVKTLGLPNENLQLKDLKYYPNPTASTFTISSSEILTAFEVTTVLGQTVMSDKINKNKLQLDLTSLPNATYFVKIITLNNEKIIKVLKQ